MSSAVDRLLERLPNARRSGPGRWRAPCPAHGSKSASLGIAERDGRVLLHCFGGCETSAVLGAVGLELRDLYDVRLGDGIKGTRSPWNPRDVLALVLREAAVIAVVGGDIAERRDVSASDWARFVGAYRRLSTLALKVAP